MRTAVICHHDDLLNREALPRWLASFSDLAGLVIIEERPEQKKNRVKRELKRVGALRFVDVLAYRVWHRFFEQGKDSRYEEAVLDRAHREFPALPADLPVHRTASPNTPETGAFLRSIAPDLVVARCKVILKPEVFSVPRLGTYVMHPGVCPEYRNAHGCFWALARRDLDRVGMTLLKIDKGIDTGPVFGFYKVPYDEVAESHVTIQHRTVFDNLDRLREKLLEIERGEAATIDTRGRASGNWGQPWLSEYLRWKRAARQQRAA